jgi:hypothetical protein
MTSLPTSLPVEAAALILSASLTLQSERKSNPGPGTSAAVTSAGTPLQLENLGETGNRKLNELHGLITATLAADGDDRPLNEIINATFEKINKRDTDVLNDRIARQAERQGAIADITGLQNVLYAQDTVGAFDPSESFTLSNDSPMRTDGWTSPTAQDVMEYYRDTYKDLGLTSPPKNGGQLKPYLERLKTAVAGILTPAAQQTLFDLQEHVQHMHAMRDLQSALFKSVGDAWGSVIKGM